MIDTASKTVLITGASSGIGRACASYLALRSFRVFAGVRKAADVESLRDELGPSVQPLLLDVTDPSSIGAAVHEVRARLGDVHMTGLDGLVNNAGIGLMAPVEYVSDAALRRSFEVNVFGQIAVTQASLPLIREAKGRIVNMGSVGGHLAIPFGGVLCASKSAFGLLSDALRLELRPFGIHVCLIEPGAIVTPAVDKTLGDVEGVLDQLPPEGVARYGDRLRAFVRRALARESKGSKPEVVAEAVFHALTAVRPRVRYPVGANARALAALPRILPDRLLDRLRLRLFDQPTRFGSA